MPFLSSSEKLGATDGMDAVTKSIAELIATVAKATKIRQEEHLNGLVILRVEDERLILSGCGDDDSLELFPEQLPSPTSMQLRVRTSREKLPTGQFGVAIQRQECRFNHNHLFDYGDSQCPAQRIACDEGASSS